MAMEEAKHADAQIAKHADVQMAQDGGYKDVTDQLSKSKRNKTAPQYH
jgi:hypothetical protein